jgi:glucosamine--fructose-6-phosphate aminotransferase (isomerizing)
MESKIMCGIVGYIGQRQAQSILISALKRLEYRGYDSSGIAISGSVITIVKDKVRVGKLAEIMLKLSGVSGIGHTRWATHGEPSMLNAHPHQDCRGKIAVVHNGVITNYQNLKSQLTAEEHIFVSETDTEVIPHLIEKYYRGNLEKATLQAMMEIEGYYAIAVVAEGEDKVVVARKGSPLIIGLGDDENIIASDIPAVLERTKRVIYLEDGDLAVVTPEDVRIMNRAESVTREVHQIDWNVEDVQKSG